MTYDIKTLKRIIELKKLKIVCKCKTFNYKVYLKWNIMNI